MALSPSEELTAQFYEWEVRGRGWHYAPYTVELEPPFVPFFVHHVPMPYTDDGKRNTFISSIVDIFRTPIPVPVIETRESEPIELYPFVETDTLAGYRISFSKSAKPSLEAMKHCLTMLSGIYTPISFELIADTSSIYFQLVYRKTYTYFIYSQFKAFFPDASIMPLDTTAIEGLFDHAIPAAYTVDFGLSE